jgi:hypothetical protein
LAGQCDTADKRLNCDFCDFCDLSDFFDYNPQLLNHFSLMKTALITGTKQAEYGYG